MLAGAALAPLAAACGGGKKKDSANGGTDPGPASGANPPGRAGGTLRISGPARIASPDPHDRVTPWVHTLKAYSQLLGYRFSTSEVLYDAAARHEQPDPTTFVLTMRTGMTFRDGIAKGRDVTAADAAFAINRIKDQAGRPGPLANSQVNALYWSWIDRAEASNAQTLTIRLAHPYASAVPTLAAPAFSIVAREAVDAGGGIVTATDGKNDGGSGPYTLTRADDSGYTWERWQGYWRHTRPSPTFVESGPYISRIEWKQAGDTGSVEAALRAGDLDLAGSSSNPGGQLAWDRLKADELAAVPGVRVARAANPRSVMGAFDNAGWTDARLREAASLAIDRDALVNQVHLGEGIYAGPLAPVFGQLALPEAELRKTQAFDPKKARQLWDAAGAAGIFPSVLLLTQTSVPLLVQLTNFIAEEWRKNLGVTVKVDAVDAATFTRRATAPVPRKDWDFALTYDPYLLTIPEANALSLYAPDAFGGAFANLRTDQTATAELAGKLQALHDAALLEVDAAARKQKLASLQQEHLRSLAPGLPMPIARNDYFAYRDWVKNFPEKDFQLGSAGAHPLRVQDLWLDRP